MGKIRPLPLNISIAINVEKTIKTWVPNNVRVLVQNVEIVFGSHM